MQQSVAFKKYISAAYLPFTSGKLYRTQENEWWYLSGLHAAETILYVRYDTRLISIRLV